MYFNKVSSRLDQRNHCVVAIFLRLVWVIVLEYGVRDLVVRLVLSELINKLKGVDYAWCE